MNTDVSNIPYALQKKLKENMGVLLSDDVDELTKYNPMLMVLVRCGCGRFMVSVGQLESFVKIIERDEKSNPELGTYIRDVSIPTTVYDKLTV